MEYKISAVKLFSEQTYGRDDNHRALVNFEGEEKDYSAFVKERPSVGDVWHGELKKTEKDDKIYWNFEFERKPTGQVKGTSSPEQFQVFMREMIAIRQLLIKIEAHTNPDKRLSDGSEPPNFDVDVSQDVPF